MKKTLLNNKNIRKTIYKNKTYFVLVDVIKEITNSKNPSAYIQKLKERNSNFSKSMRQNVAVIKIENFGTNQKMNCINFENLLELIKYIPSKKIENFKNKIYEIGLEKIDEVGK